MLLQIRDFIHRAQVASTQQLTREFHVDAQALQPMLDLLVKKGVIRQCNDKSTCQSKCFRCHTTPPMFYQPIT